MESIEEKVYVEINNESSIEVLHAWMNYKMALKGADEALLKVASAIKQQAKIKLITGK